MQRATLLMTAATAVALLSPAPTMARDCSQAINEVEQQVQQGRKSDDWNRIQVQLYIAAQFLQKGADKDCLQAVQEARAIAGMPKETAAGPDTTASAPPTDEAEKHAMRPDASNPPGADIVGRDHEGWGNNEAQANAIPPAEADKMIGKTVRSTQGEELGKVVDVVGETGGPERLVVATGEKKVPIRISELRYDKENDVVLANKTKKELKNALTLKGGVSTGAHAGGGANSSTQ